MISLHLPKGPRKYSKQKLSAYKRHWAGVRKVQDEFSSQYIHEGLKLQEIVDESQISRATVARFFHFGQGNGKMGYSYFHGPAVTTIFGIADALGLEFKLQRKNGKRNGS